MFARQELETSVSQDGQIIIKFPETIPVGATVHITLEIKVIEPEVLTGRAAFGVPSVTSEETSPVVNPAREAARAKLAAAGLLGTAHMPPDDLVAPSEERLREIAERASGGPSIAEIMNEIRGDR